MLRNAGAKLIADAAGLLRVDPRVVDDRRHLTDRQTDSCAAAFQGCRVRTYVRTDGRTDGRTYVHTYVRTYVRIRNRIRIRIRVRICIRIRSRIRIRCRIRIRFRIRIRISIINCKRPLRMFVEQLHCLHLV